MSMRWRQAGIAVGVAACLAAAGGCAHIPVGERQAWAAEPSRVLRVGPGRALERPSQAARVAKDGDIVEIDAGIYRGDAAVWRQNDLTIRGVGGRARLEAAGAHAEGKAIWVIKGRNTTIERVEFTGARVPDGNGAGIRQEGPGLIVRACRFDNNENGILAGERPESDITVEFSEFAHNGSGDGRTHNLYIGAVRTFTLRGSYSHHTRIGHNVKSRARTTFLLYNRLADEEDGTASYAIDLPNGGTAFVIGNILQQGPRTDNPTIVSYGAEGVGRWPNALYVVNNTLINDRRRGGRFIDVARRAERVRIINNVFAGPGTVLSGRGELSHNVVIESDAAAPVAIHAARGGWPQAIDAGIDPGKVEGVALLPDFHYRHPASIEPRVPVGPPDLGAYEWAPAR